MKIRTPLRDARVRPPAITGASSAHGQVPAIHCCLAAASSPTPSRRHSRRWRASRETTRCRRREVSRVPAPLVQELQRDRRGRVRPRRDGFPGGFGRVGRQPDRAVSQGRLGGPADVKEEFQVVMAVAVTMPGPGPDAQGSGTLQQGPGLDPPLLARQLSQLDPGQLQHALIRQWRGSAEFMPPDNIGIPGTPAPAIAPRTATRLPAQAPPAHWAIETVQRSTAGARVRDRPLRPAAGCLSRG